MRKYMVFVLLAILATCKQKTASTPIAPPDGRHQGSGIAIDPELLKKYDDSLLTDFYSINGFRTMWNRANLRKELINSLSLSSEQGLNPKDYDTEKWLETETRSGNMTENELVAYDIGLTLSAQKYISHLLHGKLNPKELYGDWDLPAADININALISGAIKGDSLLNVIRQSEPQHEMYRKLKKALKIADGFPGDMIEPIEVGDRKFYPNDSHDAIVAIKKRLMFWNDLSETNEPTKIYDKKTVKAVKHFQARHGLTPDGVIGPGTINALNFTRIQRRQQIVANLERWRWFPRDLGDNYVLLNIPAYALYVIKDGDTIAKRRIVVGKTERKTPVLSSAFSSVILNPTWTVPPTIVREDLTPDAIRSRSYFWKKKIIIYDWKGNVVSPYAWNPSKSTTYRYVQRPGKGNLLGSVKFNFPNHYTVYLHDTNSPYVFGMNKRSLSSGCVRVENPLELAEYMLDDKEKWGLDKITEVVASNETTTIQLSQKIRVHLLYWTAWTENEQLVFRDDIYGLDYELFDCLRY